jgi:hypothetical protein
VSVFIANPIHDDLRFTAPRNPKRKGGNPEALAGWFSDRYRANVARAVDEMRAAAGRGVGLVVKVAAVASNECPRCGGVSSDLVCACRACYIGDYNQRRFRFACHSYAHARTAFAQNVKYGTIGTGTEAVLLCNLWVSFSVTTTQRSLLLTVLRTKRAPRWAVCEERVRAALGIRCARDHLLVNEKLLTLMREHPIAGDRTIEVGIGVRASTR